MVIRSRSGSYRVSVIPSNSFIANGLAEMSVALIPFVLVLVGGAFSVAEPPNSLKAYRRETRSHGRGFVVEELANHRRDREESSNSIPCVKSFLTKYIKAPAWTSFLVLDADDDLQEFARSLRTSFDLEFAFFEPRNETNFEPLERAFNAILLMSNSSSVADGFRAPEPCDRSCTFVCVLTTIFQDKQTFLDQVDALVRSMWAGRIAKVVVLAKVRDAVLAAGSRTFRTQQLCVPSAAVVFDECKKNSWNKLRELRAPRLNRCILKVAYFEQSPRVTATNGSEELIGYEGRLIEETLREQSIDREKVEWNDNTSYTEQIEMFLYNDAMADLVIGGILRQSGGDIGYSTTYDMLKVVWLIPKVPNVSLKGLIRPFEPYVWAAIGGSLLLGGVVKTFLSRDLSWLDIFAFIIGYSVPSRPTKLSSKIQFISWNIFGLFLTQLYVDSLADQLINVSDFKIESMQELMNSSFEIGGTASFATVFDAYEESDEIVEQIREKFVTFDKDAYTRQFEDLLSGKNNTFALAVVLNSSRSDAIETVYAYMLTAEPICSFPLVLATWKGFPYLADIDQSIVRFQDFGILDFMIEMAIAKDAHVMMAIAEDEQHKAELHLQQFVPAFLLTAMGFVGGFILLLLEIVLYPSKLLV